MRILHTYANSCIYETHFGAGTVYDSVGKLTVDVLLSDDTDIDEYVIDWYLDDIETPIKFTSGVGTDPDITYTHPFLGNASYPAEAGTWIPRIRYIIVDGVKLYPQHRPWEDFCELPTINVQAYTCSNGGIGTYAHTIEYINTLQKPELAAQTVTHELDVGILWFAIRFFGYDVSDRITIYYCTEEDPDGVLLEDIVIGTDAGPSSWYTSPKICSNSWSSSQGYAIVLNFDGVTIQSGDYLKVSVSPSYIQPPNLNTNWKLQFKCGNVATPFVCHPWTSNMQTIDTSTIAMSWNAVSCRYELTMSTIDDMPANWNTSDAYKYFTIASYSSAYLYQFYQNTVGTYFNKNYSLSWSYTSSYSGCTNASAITYVWNKSLHRMTITCSDDVSYNAYKSEYNAVIVHPRWVDWTPDGTQLNHYKQWSVWQRVANSCGDAYVIYTYFFDYASVFSFDDINRIVTIDASPPETNEYVDGECEVNFHTNIDSRITQISNMYNTADFTRVTYVKYPTTGTILGIYNNKGTNNTFTIESWFAYYHPIDTLHTGINDECLWEAPWCYENRINVNSLVPIYYRYRFIGKIYPTDTEDPTQNFEVWNGLDEDGCKIPSTNNYILIYKEVDDIILQAWDIGSVPYALDDMVINANRAWKSLQNNNYEEPTVESAWWHKISSI